jgi:hypothetical protein
MFAHLRSARVGCVMGKQVRERIGAPRSLKGKGTGWSPQFPYFYGDGRQQARHKAKITQSILGTKQR